MAIITIKNLEDTLDSARATLLSSTSGDGIISRDDFQQLQEQTEDPLEKKFLGVFYDFLLQLDFKPRKRVTEAVIDRGISFIREEVIPQLELRLIFGIGANQKTAQVPEAGSAIGSELFTVTSNELLLSPDELKDQIADLANGDLFFEDYGSEEAKPIEAFFQTHPGKPLSPNSFIDAIGLEPGYENSEVSYFDAADQVLENFIKNHTEAGLSNRARALVELMKENLNDFKLVILGNPRSPSLRPNFPVYVVGRGYDGNLAGFSSIIVWNQETLPR
ncbi:MAG: nuclease A inhibitor family protein [Bacteroidota bacterium]